MVLNAFLFSSAVATTTACPHLAGNYTCSTGNGQSEVLQITENFNGEIPIYFFNGSELDVDGKPHPLSGDSTMRKGVFRVRCENDALIMETSGQFFEGDKKLGEFRMTTTTRLESDKLVEMTDGVSRNGDGTTPLSDQTDCVRY